MKPEELFGHRTPLEWGPYFCLAVLDHRDDIRSYLRNKGEDRLEDFCGKISAWWTRYRDLGDDEACVTRLYSICDGYDVVQFLKDKSYIRTLEETREVTRAAGRATLRGTLDHGTLGRIAASFVDPSL